MIQVKWCRLGLMVAPGDVYSPYYTEILAHAGIPFTLLDKLDELRLGEFDILIFAGESEVPAKLSKHLTDWVERGGRAIFSGSAWGVHALIGLQANRKHTSMGWISLGATDRLVPTAAKPVKFFGGKSHANARSKVVLTDSDGHVALSRNAVGRGKIWYFAPHAGQTIAMMQLGRSVETDGISPRDGSARLDDGLLRAEDGILLDFESDRDTSGSTAYFSQAHADIIREIFVRAVIEAMESTAKPYYLTWPWPNNADAIGLLTIDCPNPDEDALVEVSRVASNLGARPAWLTSIQGFPVERYRAMHGFFQEIGVLYMPEAGKWDAEKLRIQQLALSRSGSFRKVDAFRPCDGQWQGHLQPYAMSQHSNARLVVSKGGRQPGTSGFAFGSCHPIRPVQRNGELIEVFEMPYQAYLPSFPDHAAEDVIQEVKLRKGCLQIAGTLEQLTEANAQASLRRLIMLAKQEGIRFYLPSEITELLETRRIIRVLDTFEDGINTFHITSPLDLGGFTILFGGFDELEASIGNHVVHTNVCERFGTKLWSATVHLESKRTLPLTLSGELTRKAA